MVDQPPAPQVPESTHGHMEDEAEGSSPNAVQDPGKEEETCGFCIFMKGGGCKDAFEVRDLDSLLVHEI